MLVSGVTLFTKSSRQVRDKFYSFYLSNLFLMTRHNLIYFEHESAIKVMMRPEHLNV